MAKICHACADPEGGGGGVQGVCTPSGKSQKYRVFSNTGPDPLENHKATKPAFHDGSSSARQQANNGPSVLMVFGSSPHLNN